MTPQEPERLGTEVGAAERGAAEGGAGEAGAAEAGAAGIGSRALSVLLFGLWGLYGLCAPAAAQDWRPSPGDRSIAFDLPVFAVIGLPGGRGPTLEEPRVESAGLGLWWQRSETRALGLELDAGAVWVHQSGSGDVDRTGMSARVSVGPAVKWYRAAPGPVSPFLGAALRLGVAWHGGESMAPWVRSSRWSAHAAGRLGLGVDWFPMDRVSVGGFTGAALGYGVAERARTDDGRRHGLDLRLFTSGLKLHIYF